MIRHEAQGHQVQQRHDGPQASTCWGTDCVREEARQSSAEPASPVSKGLAALSQRDGPGRKWGETMLLWDYPGAEGEMESLWPKRQNWRKPIPSSGLGRECSFLEAYLEVHSPSRRAPPVVECGNLIKSDLDDS